MDSSQNKIRIIKLFAPKKIEIIKILSEKIVDGLKRKTHNNQMKNTLATTTVTVKNRVMRVSVCLLLPLISIKACNYCFNAVTAHCSRLHPIVNGGRRRRSRCRRLRAYIINLL